MPKNAEEFDCKICAFKCSKKSNFEKHLLTDKHINRTYLNVLEHKNAKMYHCKNCNKEYTARNSLWYHEKKCMVNFPSTKIENKEELFTYLMKENEELKEMIKEVIKNGTHNTINNTTNKNKFNLNFFLNETCKDALNITDFINNINPKLKDLENTAKNGYVSGISNIIIKELKNMDISKRPIHCSDLKRETLYVKDNDAWEKENEEKIKLKKAIKEVANKNIKKIPDWLKEHPHHKDYNHSDNDDYMNLLTSCMAGENNDEEMGQIIKNLSKEVVIEKS